LVAAYAEAIAPALDALQARHGMAFELLDGFRYPGHRARRMHTLPERTGAALMAALERAAAAAGADIVTQALVHELWCNHDGQVLGIGHERPDGRTEHLRCDVLLLACNGFGGNADMVDELLPGMRHATFAGHAGNDGSAIAWGRQLGARLADLQGCQGHGSWAVPQGVLVTWALMTEGGVQINARGERFHDETQGYSEAAVQVLAQPGAIAWNVFDDALLSLAREFPDFRAAEAAGALRTVADVSQLAELIGCAGEPLALTLRDVRCGHADAFGRTFTRALNEPLHAVKVTGALFHTQGGLDIDADSRVLRHDGVPLPNLLAAGGAARGVSGNSVSGYLSGNGLLSAVAGGFIAARTAATFLACEPMP
jgi:fumarate reductase flavoprotein subunit